ncbi:MAG TPA: hypothetical protein VHW95_05015, partial [Steroidobacteraceae bacterium]|nr:hypothetical protein [Steroidobacteraceae bacterium]
RRFVLLADGYASLRGRLLFLSADFLRFAALDAGPVLHLEIVSAPFASHTREGSSRAGKNQGSAKQLKK